LATDLHPHARHSHGGDGRFYLVWLFYKLYFLLQNVIASGASRQRDQTPSTGGLCRARGYGPGYAWIRLTYVLRSLSKTLCDLHLLRRVRQAQSPTGRQRPQALLTELEDPVTASLACA
jgi:hypothetical protein